MRMKYLFFENLYCTKRITDVCIISHSCCGLEKGRIIIDIIIIRE